MDIQYLMKQARKLEKAMADAKEKLGDIVVEAESGGGLVKVSVNGRCEVVRLAIDPRALEPFGSAERRAEAQPEHRTEPVGSAERRAEAQPEHRIDPDAKAMLEDLVTAAVNAGVEKARAAADEAMQKATGGVKIPGIAG